ncbi:MAG: transporter substrate-binding domain-containing protein [Pseudomonadota bacterium]
MTDDYRIGKERSWLKLWARLKGKYYVWSTGVLVTGLLLLFSADEFSPYVLSLIGILDDMERWTGLSNEQLRDLRVSQSRVVMLLAVLTAWGVFNLTEWRDSVAGQKAIEDAKRDAQKAIEDAKRDAQKAIESATEESRESVRNIKAELEARLVLLDRADRWEELLEHPIKWSYVPFFPTTFRHSHTQDILGPGVRLFSRLMKNAGIPKLEPEEEGRGYKFIPNMDGDVDAHGLDFDEVASALDTGTVDVIVTPLYELRDRLQLYDFCTPLYFADIGCYVHTDVAKTMLRDQNDRLSWEDVCELIRSKKLITSYLPGEIHYRICRKVWSTPVDEDNADGKFEKQVLPFARAEQMSVRRVLNLLGGERPSNKLQYFFAERKAVEDYQEHLRSLGTQPLDLVNIMSQEQRIYPAAFVVRRGNDTLRRWLNYQIYRDHGNIYREFIPPPSPASPTMSLTNISPIRGDLET